MNLKQAAAAVRKAQVKLRKARTHDNALALQKAQRRHAELKRELIKAVE